MKKCTLLSIITIMLAWTTSVSAQSFVLDWQDPPTVARADSSVVTAYGEFRNVSGSSKSILFRTEFDGVLEEHSMRLCFGDFCYFVFRDAVPDERDPFNMPGNSKEKLKAQMVPYGVSGTSTMVYTIFDRANPTDTMRYAVTFIMQPVSSVEDISSVAVSVGPNPASSVITVSGEAVPSIKALNLYTSQGQLRRTFPMTHASAMSLDVSDIAPGAYHLMFTLANGNVHRAAVTIIR